MKVLVDTPVWSLALRRQAQDLVPYEVRLRFAFSELVKDSRVLMIGLIRQELLSGIREQAQFERLRDLLRAFPDHPIRAHSYERAAQMSNDCRSRGISSTPTDMLICSVAYENKSPILTTDNDFQRYSNLLPITLFAHDEL